MTLMANTRMYNVSRDVEAAWTDLIAATARLSGVPLAVLDHPAPRPVEDLWARRDLGLVMMCGWPFFRARPRPEAVAAPILADDRAGGRAVYWTDMIVDAEGPARTLADSFGGTLAWTVPGSHSGFNAPRHLLRPYFEKTGRALYADTIGPVVTPRGSIEAVLSGRATVAPLDGYFHNLLKRHEPETAARLRVVATTPEAPVPLFTASHGTDPDVVARLRAGLCALVDDPCGAEVLEALCLSGFAPVEIDNYATGDLWEAEAERANYPAPA
jgi:ABC-type phosphate/phosphonate transport system substrate-binding protein